MLEELRAEHAQIEAVVDALLTWADALEARQADVAHGHAFVSFFRLFAGDYHHGREEGVLFPALVSETEVPGDRGPLAVLTMDHEIMGEMLTLLDEACAVGDRPRAEALRHARQYAEAILHHIDAENHVLFSEAEARFRRANVSELPSRAPSDEEAHARALGVALVQRFPARPREHILRGESCTVCPAFGVRCEGVEREWWGEHEREDFFDRLGS